MANDSRVKIVKDLIAEDRLQNFADIFLYLTKTEIAAEMGINYTRFLKLVDNPKRFRYEESILLAKILKVSPRQISDLIHNQIEGKKRK